jgi:menaquinone-dependent protoporphyrinogen oxidase
MRVLVAVASKHGGTMGIGEAVAKELREAGIETTFEPIEEVNDLKGFDAAVIGSAVYADRWMGEASSFIEEHAGELGNMPVWLFSSGGLGPDQPEKPRDPHQVAGIMKESGARGHRLFAGVLDPSQLNFAERLIFKMVHTPAGDYRNWDEIRAWGREIGTTLLSDNTLKPVA